MPNFNVTITPQRTVNVRVAINQGAPGPNRITEQTATPIIGVLVGDGGSVRPAEEGEVVSQADMQSALPAPLRIPTGEQFSVPVNRQMPFRYPITVEPGAQLIVPANSILYQA